VTATETSVAPSATRPWRWALFARIALALSFGSLALFCVLGISEASVRVWVRATARASVALFLMTFVARPLVQLRLGRASRWLLANRRYLGASAAFAQLLHAASIAWLFAAYPGARQASATTLILGGLGMAFYFAMGLSSSDGAVALLGRRAWKALHTAGAYWIWLIFAFTNWGNVQLALSGELGVAHRVLYVGIEAALLAALFLRWAARVSSARSARS
jgi:hypothetical protein